MGWFGSFWIGQRDRLQYCVNDSCRQICEDMDFDLGRLKLALQCKVDRYLVLRWSCSGAKTKILASVNDQLGVNIMSTNRNTSNLHLQTHQLKQQIFGYFITTAFSFSARDVCLHLFWLFWDQQSLIAHDASMKM